MFGRREISPPSPPAPERPSAGIDGVDLVAFYSSFVFVFVFCFIAHWLCVLTRRRRVATANGATKLRTHASSLAVRQTPAADRLVVVAVVAVAAVVAVCVCVCV